MKLLLAALLLIGAFNTFAADPDIRPGEIVSLIERREMDGVQSYMIGTYHGVNKYTLERSYDVSPLRFYAETGEWVGSEGTKVEGVFRSPTYSYDIRNHLIGKMVREYHGFSSGDRIKLNVPEERAIYNAEIAFVFSNGVVVVKFVDNFKRVRTSVTTLKKLGLENNYEN